MASAKNTKVSKKEEVQLELIYSDETQFKYWESHLFNDVYLRKDLPVKHKDLWDFEEDLGFQNFMNTLRDLAVEYDGREKELQNWSETETINNWVKHVLNALGWSDNCTGVQNPFLEETSFRYDDKTYRTDILIVDLPKEKQYINKAKGDDKLVQAREAVLIPVEAKYWNRLEQYRQGQNEEKKRVDAQSDDTSKSMTPNEQTIKYMEILKKDWGVLTDGATWRLFNREISSEDSQRYYEFNLQSLIESLLTEETEHDRQEIMEAAKYFYFFFSKKAIFPEDESEQPLVEEVLIFSKKYVNKVEEDLKDRFVKAMNFACNGFHKAIKRTKYKADMETIRNVSESALFNILFTKSLESRNVLPMNSDGYRKISLSSIVDKIERFDPNKDMEINVRNLERTFKKSNGSSFFYKTEGVELHNKIVQLTRVIHDGKSKKDDFGFEISGFRESVFSNQEWKIFKECKLSNENWVNILFQLGYAESETKTRKYQQIPYSFFTPRQLGSIYESFLEFNLDEAGCDMVYEKKQWKKVNLKSRKYKNTSLPLVYDGELFFTPDNKDRKSSGSYYTPDNFVQYAVSESLSGLVKNKSSEEILKIKICDPSMGSGHFLVGALNYLTKAYLSALAEESEGDIDISLPEAKRKVLDVCIYGIDINPRAVKLAKMSLWLESAFINCKLENLDDQLFVSDTLKLEKPIVRGIDAFIGNPPWVLKRDSELTKEYKKYIEENYRSAEGFKKNLFPLFLERICTWEGNHSINLVLPNRLLDTPSYKETRRVAFDKYNYIKITSLPENSFENVTASYITLFLTNKKVNLKRKSQSEIEIFDFLKKDPKLIYRKNELNDDYKVNINRSQNLVHFIDRLNDISDHLVDNFFCHVGMMVKDNKNQFSEIKSKNKSVKIVKGDCLGQLELEGTYFFDPSGVVVFGGTKRKEKHEFVPKLFVRKTGNFILSSKDDGIGGPVYAEQSVYLVIPKNKEAEGNIDLINLYLNTKIPTLFFRSELITNPDSYPYIQQYDLEKIPVPRDLFENKKLRNELKSILKSKVDINKKISKAEQKLLIHLDIPLEDTQEVAA